MSTLTTTKKPLHPLIRVVSIGLIVFSAVRIGDFMGWTSTANGGANDKAALEQQVGQHDRTSASDSKCARDTA